MIHNLIDLTLLELCIFIVENDYVISNYDLFTRKRIEMLSEFGIINITDEKIHPTQRCLDFIVEGGLI